MKKQNSIMTAFPVLFGFFVMGFCDIVGISSDYVQRSFNWSPMMTGFVPSMVFVWFLFLGIPIGNRMNKWGRKNTVLVSMVITIVGMILPLLAYDGVTCMVAYALLGIGNAILQVSLNPLLNNVITNKAFLTSSLTVGQVIKAASSLVGPEIVLLAVHYWGMDKWYYCFPILGFITLLSTVWLIATPIERERNVVSNSDLSMRNTFALLKDRTILLLFLGIFFIVGVDVATNFISSKLMSIRFGWSDEQVKFAPQVYFLSRTIGALLGAFLLTRIAEMKYFRINIVACVVSLLVLMGVEKDVVNMCANNYLAIGCLQMLRQKGVRIPEDIALMTFDNYPFSMMLKPQLTAIEVDMFELGWEAAHFMLQKLRKPNLQTQSFCTVPTLVEREST